MHMHMHIHTHAHTYTHTHLRYTSPRLYRHERKKDTNLFVYEGICDGVNLAKTGIVWEINDLQWEVTLVASLGWVTDIDNSCNKRARRSEKVRDIIHTRSLTHTHSDHHTHIHACTHTHKRIHTCTRPTIRLKTTRRCISSCEAWQTRARRWPLPS